jgi:hypothetical protein
MLVWALEAGAPRRSAPGRSRAHHSSRFVCRVALTNHELSWRLDVKFGSERAAHPEMSALLLDFSLGGRIFPGAVSGCVCRRRR